MTTAPDAPPRSERPEPEQFQEHQPASDDDRQQEQVARRRRVAASAIGSRGATGRATGHIRRHRMAARGTGRNGCRHEGKPLEGSAIGLVGRLADPHRAARRAAVAPSARIPAGGATPRRPESARVGLAGLRRAHRLGPDPSLDLQCRASLRPYRPRPRPRRPRPHVPPGRDPPHRHPDGLRRRGRDRPRHPARVPGRLLPSRPLRPLRRPRDDPRPPRLRRRRRGGRPEDRRQQDEAGEQCEPLVSPARGSARSRPPRAARTGRSHSTDPPPS